MNVDGGVHQPRERGVACRYCSRTTRNVHGVCARCSPLTPESQWGGRRVCCADDPDDVVWPELVALRVLDRCAAPAVLRPDPPDDDRARLLAQQMQRSWEGVHRPGSVDWWVVAAIGSWVLVWPTAILLLWVMS